jgi:hypothetical protein
MRSFIVGIAILCLTLSSGCGRGTSSVRGKVTYQGKALTYGAVIFMPDDNNSYPADIQPDGSYTIHAVPRGKCRVVVQVSDPRPPSRPQPRANAKDGFGKAEAMKDDAKAGSRLPTAPEPKKSDLPPPIPPRFANPETSGLNVDLSEAEKTYNIELN